MDWQTLEARLEQAFTARPRTYGDARVVELSKPIDLEELLGQDENLGISEQLEELGAECTWLMSFNWSSLGPMSWSSGIYLFGVGATRYLVWWDDEGPSYVVAAVTPWSDSAAVSGTIRRLFGSVGEEFGVKLFGAVPDWTSADSTFVPRDVVEDAFWDALDWLESAHGAGWKSLAHAHFSRIVEPNPMQRALDDLALGFEDARARSRREAEADDEFPPRAKRELLRAWLERTYHEDPSTAEAVEGGQSHA